MNLKQISTLINDSIVPNTMGEAITIAEDLSNVVDLGTAIADLTADDIKNFQKNFVVGIAKTFFDARLYEGSDYGIFSDTQTYGGIVQRVKAKLLETEDSPIWTLENGTDYFDGTYRGIETDNKLFTQDAIWKITNSIPTEEFKQYFLSEEGVLQLIALIESTVQNTLRRNIHALSKRTLCSLAGVANQIHLLTLYASESGRNLTAQEAILDKDFLLWLGVVIVRLRDMVTEYNTKYNDGTIETFTPKEDTRVTILTEVDKKMNFFMTSDVFHNDLVSIGQYNTINFWQNQGTTLLPNLGVTAEVKLTDGEDEPTITDITGLIGLIYDKYSCGTCARLSKTSSQYIGAGDYTNYYHHIAHRRFVDSRNSAIALILD